MSKILLKKFNTSLSKLNSTDQKTYLQKISKYLKNPLKIFPRILWEFNKYFYEIDWNERIKKMGNSAVFGNEIDEDEQNEITKIHKKIIFKCLEGKLKKNSNILDFGC